MAKDKKKNDAAKKSVPKKEQAKKQDAKVIKAKASKGAGKKADKNTKKSGPVAEKKPNLISKLFTYLSEVRAELKRVTWPTREKVIYLVGVVVVTLVFFAVFTATVDWASSEGVVALNSLTETERTPGGNEVPVELDLESLGLGDDDLFVEEGIVEEGATEVTLDADANGDNSVDETDE